jgi:hypothetical protein
MRFKAVIRILMGVTFFFLLTGFIGMPRHPVSVAPNAEELTRAQRVIYRIKPEKRGGEAFKLIYLVPASVDIFWGFKTDFSGDFLLSNRYIKEHHLIKKMGNVIITENSYTNAPGERFRWRTKVYPGQYRLDFQLENPDECGQKFHYGTIQLEPFGSQTKVTHIAYFDFFGAYIWVNLPVKGGMRSFLIYTANWERETVTRLRDRYAKPSVD